jgi:PKHD-type hydroxylase
MIVCILDVLPSAEVQPLQWAIRSLNFVDGRRTAGWAARLVKSNEQAEAADEQVHVIAQQIAIRILDNDLFQLTVRPKHLTNIMLSRYTQGTNMVHTSMTHSWMACAPMSLLRCS